MRQRPLTTGHVVMFASVSCAWLVLFVVNLVWYEPTQGWWMRAVFSGLLLLASIAITVTLYQFRAR